MNKLEKFQTILKTIRFILGMNCQEFGNMLGITKQTVSNYETGKTKISKIMYIGIRALLDKINDPMINDIIEVVVDNPDKYDDANNIALTIDLFAKAIYGGARKEIINYTPMEYEKIDWLSEIL